MTGGGDQDKSFFILGVLVEVSGYFRHVFLTPLPTPCIVYGYRISVGKCKTIQMQVDL